MEFSAWLKAYRKERGLSQPGLAEWLNGQAAIKRKIDRYAIGNWEQGRSQPDFETCLAIGYSAGVSDPYSTFLDVEHGYRLNEDGWRRLDEYARLLEGSADYARPTRPARARGTLRYYTIPVSAGLGQFLDSDDYEDREREGWEPSDADFAVPVAGDSMEPRIINGQWIFVKEQEMLESGEIGVFRYDGESYCKVLRFDNDGRPVLHSLNAAYEPLPVRLVDTFAVIGKVVG
ncbi:LexA family transcriptional regulator [Ruminococcaceae bacterium OttesenSCG-928-D13]|nr:LexA family transcriptional regulator [Ruminococcaceae bacterium OttesenSCG-928-D13]